MRYKEYTKLQYAVSGIHAFLKGYDIYFLNFEHTYYDVSGKRRANYGMHVHIKPPTRELRYKCQIDNNGFNLPSNPDDAFCMLLSWFDAITFNKY